MKIGYFERIIYVNINLRDKHSKCNVYPFFVLFFCIIMICNLYYDTYKVTVYLIDAAGNRNYNDNRNKKAEISLTNIRISKLFFLIIYSKVQIVFSFIIKDIYTF